MGQIENMTEKDVENLTAMIDAMNRGVMRETPMTFKTFPMEDLEFAQRLAALEDKVDAILTKITNIFGDAILINGRFREIKIPRVD